MTAQPKQKKLKVVEGLCLGCLALVIVVMLYGVIRYPYAPIRLREDGYYRDKAGHVFTEAQFRSFTIWEGCLVGSFVALAAASATLVISHHGRRGR